MSLNMDRAASAFTFKGGMLPMTVMELTSADPEQMHALMDRCFRILLEQVHAFEGTINQFTGDGIMALFGAPVALEDAPRRAVAAALRCQDALEPLRREVRERMGAEFQIRVGVNTGLVVVGRIGPIGALHQVGVEPIDSAAVPLRGFLDQSDIRQLRGRIGHFELPLSFENWTQPERSDRSF